MSKITYHREGDYLIPDLLPPESPKIGVWGMRRRNRIFDCVVWLVTSCGLIKTA